MNTQVLQVVCKFTTSSGTSSGQVVQVLGSRRGFRLAGWKLGSLGSLHDRMLRSEAGSQMVFKGSWNFAKPK